MISGGDAIPRSFAYRIHEAGGTGTLYQGAEELTASRYFAGQFDKHPRVMFSRSVLMWKRKPIVKS